MKKFLKPAFAAILAIAAFSACKPTLEPSKIAEEDFYAKITLTVKVKTVISGQDVDIANCPVTIKRGDGTSYDFVCNSNGSLTHAFPVEKPAKKDATLADSFTVTVDFEHDNALFGHQVGSATKNVTIAKGETSADATVTVTCTKK